MLFGVCGVLGAGVCVGLAMWITCGSLLIKHDHVGMTVVKAPQFD